MFLAQFLSQLQQFGLDHLLLKEGLVYLFAQLFLFFIREGRAFLLEEGPKFASFVEVGKDLPEAFGPIGLLFL